MIVNACNGVFLINSSFIAKTYLEASVHSGNRADFNRCVLALMARLRRMPDHEYLQYLVAYYAAPTWQGLKPATLIRPDAGGRNLVDALVKTGQRLSRIFGVGIADFRNRAGDLLLLIYQPCLLRSVLTVRETEALLREAGYETPAANLETVLARLRQKCSCQRFPHEIGVFLGYPPCDVRRFMAEGGRHCPNREGNHCWRAYGDDSEARQRSRSYRQAKHRAAELIVGGADLDEMANTLRSGAA